MLESWVKECVFSVSHWCTVGVAGDDVADGSSESTSMKPLNDVQLSVLTCAANNNTAYNKHIVSIFTASSFDLCTLIKVQSLCKTAECF